MEIYTSFSAVFFIGLVIGLIDGPMKWYRSENVSEHGWKYRSWWTNGIMRRMVA